MATRSEIVVGEIKPFQKGDSSGCWQGGVCFYLWAVQYGEESNIYLCLAYLAQESIGYLTVHAEHQKDALAIPTVV